MSTRDQAIKQAEMDYAYAVRKMETLWEDLGYLVFGSIGYQKKRAEYDAAITRMSAVANRLHALKTTDVGVKP